MRNIIFLIGRSGTGKSTLEFNLLKKHPAEFHRIMSYATRSPRPGEKDGEVYHFITQEEFLKMRTEFIQETHFAGNSYATKKADYLVNKPFTLFAVVPSQAVIMKKIIEENFSDTKVRIVYFDISLERIKSNFLSRGETEEGFLKRMSKDNIEEEMKTLNLPVDYRVKDEDLKPELDSIFYEYIKANWVWFFI